MDDSPRRHRELDLPVTDLVRGDRDDVLTQHCDVAAVADFELSELVLVAVDERDRCG